MMPKSASSAHPVESYELSKIWARTTPKIRPSPIWLYFRSVDSSRPDESNDTLSRLIRLFC